MTDFVKNAAHFAEFLLEKYGCEFPKFQIVFLDFVQNHEQIANKSPKITQIGLFCYKIGQNCLLFAQMQVCVKKKSAKNGIFRLRCELLALLTHSTLLGAYI